MITFSQLGRWGRLGNQLYEYAALLGIGAELGFEVAIPPLDRHDLATAFDVRARILTAADRRRIRHVFEEPRVGYHDRYRGIVDGTDLRGYFQSPRYFPPDDVLRSELPFRADVAAAADAALAPWRATGRTVVGMTVRRGDYRSDPVQFVQVWASEFHDRAVAHLEAQPGVDDPIVLVSSDEPAWCRTRFTGHRFHVLGDEPDVVQLAMLAGCDHVVIANSSFAWWAAWLNPGPGLRIAPDRWWGEAAPVPEGDRDPLPDGWLALSVGAVGPDRSPA